MFAMPLWLDIDVSPTLVKLMKLGIVKLVEVEGSRASAAFLAANQRLKPGKLLK